MTAAVRLRVERERISDTPGAKRVDNGAPAVEHPTSLP